MTGWTMHQDLLRSNERELRRRHPAVTIRSAGLGDGELLDRLAALDSTAPPTGAVLLAQRGGAPTAGASLLAGVGGEPLAALELATGRFVADPFRRSDEVRALLAVR